MNGGSGGKVRAVLRGVVDGLVDLGGKRPWLVLACAVAMLAACWGYATRLQVRSDIMELLPRDSPGFQAFERRLARQKDLTELVRALEEAPTAEVAKKAAALS